MAARRSALDRPRHGEALVVGDERTDLAANTEGGGEMDRRLQPLLTQFVENLKAGRAHRRRDIRAAGK
jgi:hypothetical protein